MNAIYIKYILSSSSLLWIAVSEVAGSVLVSEYILYLQQTCWEIYGGSKSLLDFCVRVIRMSNDLLFVAEKLMGLCVAQRLQKSIISAYLGCTWNE